MVVADQIKNIVGERFKENESLASYSTFHIGGPAKYFVSANSADEIERLVKIAVKSKLPYVVIGCGSNILFSDSGYDGLVIKSCGNRLNIKGELIECDAGVILTKAMGEAVGAGLSGLEWAAGIPGTVGGAVRGNAGAYGSDMGKSVMQVQVLRNGKMKKLSVNDCKFGYRHSLFKEAENKDTILSVVLKLEKTDADALKEKIKNILQDRASKFQGFSAGCVFKNIEVSTDEIVKFKSKYPDFPDQYVEYKKIPAAWLIDQCGLKGKEIGGAKISENHAGIIINTGNATAENVIMLISVIKQKVRSQFHLQLMEEIEYIGF